MAGDWIKMQTHLWDHPKVVRILSAMCPQGVRDTSARCRVIGALFRTWALADAHSEDGILDGYDADALDSAVGIEGWSMNLQHVGWLIVETQRLVVPRFSEHNGASAKRRSEDAKRKKNVRKMSDDSPKNVRSRADKMRTREEKRREDNKPPNPQGDSADFSFPQKLDTPLCRASWAEWIAYRKDAKIKPYKSEASIKQQLSRLSELGPERMVAAIRYSIAQGYQGIYEERQGAAAAKPKSSTPVPTYAPEPKRDIGRHSI